MQTTTSTFAAPDGTVLFVRRWAPDGTAVGSVQIAHGMGEHSARYGRLAEALVGAGWLVVAPDQRGHGLTAAENHVELGDLGPAGWEGLVGDVASLNDALAAESAERPRVVLGHSMGSFAAQQFALDHGADIAGLVLSGTTAVDVAASVIDPEAGTDLTAMNAAFEPARTDFDWLNRDEAEVDRYVADPLCGFGLDAASTRSLIAAAPRLADPGALAAIRSDLPVYVVSGSADPLNLELSLVDLVVQRYRDAGLVDVTTDYRQGARHEVFNETDRDEVTAHLLSWLGRLSA
ncbi:MAG TPA: alpha/beta hydrolase [Acidimicrobiales bacterium]|nr:alpha/beta hydrolase [Acidimicrobiales bacterium]